jgi:hypothetical protein
MVMAVEVNVSSSDVVSSDVDVLSDEESSVLAQESIRPKANAKQA